MLDYWNELGAEGALQQHPAKLLQILTAFSKNPKLCDKNSDW